MNSVLGIYFKRLRYLLCIRNDGEISCQDFYLSFLSDIIGIKLLMGDTFRKIVL